jgi:hypothetical protein
MGKLVLAAGGNDKVERRIDDVVSCNAEVMAV